MVGFFAPFATLILFDQFFACVPLIFSGEGFAYKGAIGFVCFVSLF
jgi:hypothetical protein